MSKQAPIRDQSENLLIKSLSIYFRTSVKVEAYFFACYNGLDYAELKEFNSTRGPQGERWRKMDHNRPDQDGYLVPGSIVTTSQSYIAEIQRLSDKPKQWETISGAFKSKDE